MTPNINTAIEPRSWHKTVADGSYLISTDASLLNQDLIVTFLSTESYWANGRPADAILETMRQSLCFGLYQQQGDTLNQVGFSRVVTDNYSFGYLADVFVLDEARGRGLGTWLIETIMTNPPCDTLKTMMLFTKDAHGLYEKFGFSVPEDASRIMMRRKLVPGRPDDRA